MYGFLWTDGSEERNALTNKYEPIQPFMLYSICEHFGCKYFFDIGSNIGLYAILLSVSKSVEKIYAFEPDDGAFEELKNNIYLNSAGDKIDASKSAVSSSNEDLIFGVHKPCSGINGVVDTSIHSRDIYDNERRVQAVTLDSICGIKDEIIALKIDVEGHEPNVLKGGVALLSSNKVIIQIEDRNKDNNWSEDILFALGFKRVFSIADDAYFFNFDAGLDDAVINSIFQSASSLLVKNNLREWPVCGTIVDSLSIKSEICEEKIDIFCEVDPIFFSEEVEFAFYLIKDGSKVGQHWYSPNAHASFPLDFQWTDVSVKVFLRDANFEEKSLSKIVDFRKNDDGSIESSGERIVFNDKDTSTSLRQKLNKINLEFEKVKEEKDELSGELQKAIQKEALSKEELSLLQKKLKNAEQRPLYILRKYLFRLKRRAQTPGALRDLALRIGGRLLRSPAHFRALLKLRTSSASGLTINTPIVPPRRLEELNIESLKDKSGKELKVACIMDDFTWLSYAPECQLTQLTPANWLDELEKLQPELLFIESAWRGKDQLWGSKVGHTSQELQEILRWCRERHIPTMFWNKEDPVHFETFLNTACLFDYVFTTDIDCVPRYKAVLGHNEVYFLPFACQPREHNPFEKYVRKDAFCFAGAYYARYPERTKDLEEFVRTLPEYRPLEIYDRNYGKDDPNYAFPEAFQPHIVGTLPFSEIDKAYKGYRYAINLNSIKQSQTMFARRVYELLASNTLTVSNFSRGLRLMFGDLVLSSDSGKQLVSELESMEAGDKADRVRLAALRKVLSEHTYEDRLNYALARITRTERKVQLPTFRMIGMANSKHDAITLLEQWKRQQGADVSLTIVHASELADELTTLKAVEGQQVIWLPYEQLQSKSLADLAEGCQWIAGASNRDYYGPNYFRDIALTTRYRVVQAIGKWASYHWSDGACELVHAGTEYRPADILFARSSAIQVTVAGEIKASEWLDGLENWRYELQDQFSIDRFNYCADVPEGQVAAEIRSQVDDLDLDHGLPLEELNRAAESALPRKDVENGSHALSGALLGRMVTRKASYADHLDQHAVAETSTVIRVSKNPAIEAELDGLYLNIVSRLSDGQHEYIYCPENISIERLATDIEGIRHQGLPLHLEVDPGLNLSLVIVFFDGAGEKVEHYIEPANRNASVSIPENALSLRFGFRVYAGGATTVRRLIFGHKSLEPGQILGKSDVLLLTNNYPSYEDLYRNGFVHSRVKGYKENGVDVDVFRFRPQEPTQWREFQNVDSITGSKEALHRVLSSGVYRHVLVHFLDEQMWEVLKDYIDDTKVTVWIHGAEIHPWYRRKYNIRTPEQEKIAKVDSDRRVSFWRRILGSMHENLSVVFVSNHFSEEVMEDLGFRLPKSQYAIINNPINTELFNYIEKGAGQRTKLLSIRPFASRQYANDLTVAMIAQLSKLPFFQELEFRIIGDGPLFDDLLEPLKQFSNVIIEKGFVSQPEIAALHKEYGLFLCPTRWDSQGVSRDEAMASGLVPVTNNVAAVGEFVSPEIAILDGPECVDELVAGITRVYQDPALFQRMSSGAARAVRDSRKSEIIIEKELSLFSLPL